MTSSAAQMRNFAGPAVLSFGFRPFFLGGALVAAIVPLATAASLAGGAVIGGAYGPILYHGREMVFGYLGAVVTGFVLTAVPNWTGRLPVVGARLLAIFGVWLVGRAAIAASGVLGPVAAAFVDAPFLLFMSAIVWREVLAGKNWRNLPVCLLMTLFAAGNVIWHVDMIRGGAGAFGLRWGVAVIAVLLALIGGRITPSFTRNWLAKTGRRPIDASISRVDQSALAGMALSMVLWLVAPAAPLTGWVLIGAAALHGLRLLRWRGWRTISEPLVAILHIGYVWLAISLALFGVSILAPSAMAPATALHALTAGAAGVMTLAVMTRASLGHTGRELRADAATLVIFALVNLGAIARLAAPFMPIDYAAASAIAGALWSGAFLLFALRYGAYLLAPRIGS